MKIKSQSGSILLSTLSFIILLAVAAASILELTMNSYKLTMRNETRAQARAVAESELEYVYYQWVNQIMSAIPASATPDVLASLNIAEKRITPDPLLAPKHPFLVAHQNQGWQVRRSIWYDPAYDYFDGIMPDTSKQGKVTYVTIRIVVLPNANSYFRNEVAVNVGRRFSTSNTSIFQYGVFYQGDLEMAPGNSVIIDGPVAANGSIYMASSPGYTLTLNKSVKYLSGDYFNEDSLGNTVLRKPNTLPGGSLVPPVFGTSQASQVSSLDAPENLVGGLDVNEIMSRRPDIFPTDNDVYRAAILPPPALDPSDYPTYDSTQGDDAVINASRMYTRAGLVVTVNTDGSIVIRNQAGTDVTSTYASAITGTADMYDQREQKNVKMTTVDMGVLISTINSNYPTGANDFNGAVYFNLVSSNPSTPRGVKVTNAQNVYGRAGLGTTITTNGGLYVQGDFNTTSGSLPDGTDNPAMLMGDQITALSSGWNDADAAAYMDASHRVASGNMQINAGILTGSTAATPTTASGGAQNLVRYLEDWRGKTVYVYGSLGRLFESKTFESVFQQPGQVYKKPDNRKFEFDKNLVMHPPAGSPTTTDFKRGSFFVW